MKRLFLIGALCLGLASPAFAQQGGGNNNAGGGGGGGSGTVTSVVCANATITTSGSCKTTPTAGTTGDALISDGNNGATDSGTLLSSLAPLVSPSFTTPALGTPASGVATNLTGTAAGLTAGSVVANANLTGPITSVGNATAVAAQTGTGSTFVMQASPTLTTPTIGAASATTVNGVTIPSGADTVDLLGTVQTISAAKTFSTAPIFSSITGSTQCLEVNTSGQLAGTGSACGGSGSTGANPTGTIGLTAVNGSATTYLRSDGAPALSQGIAPTWTAEHIFNAAGALSTPSVLFNGTPLTSGGSGTTTFPLVYINQGAGPTTFSTGGTEFGINAPSGFAGNFLDLHLNGGASLFSVSSTGAITSAASMNISGNIIATVGIMAGSAGTLGWSSRGLISSQAVGSVQLGATDAAAPVAQTFSAQSVVAGTSNTGGANMLINGSKSTGSGAGGTITLQTTGSTAGSTTQNAEVAGLTVSGAGVVALPNIASSSSAATGSVCWTTGGGNLTVDTTTTCLLSDMRAKEHIKPLDVGLREVLALKPISYDVKASVDPVLHALGRQVGLGAQDVQKVDPRLVSLYGSGPDKGTPSGVRYEQLTAVLVKAIQQQQVEIVSLQAEVATLEKAH
jgi:hypothetical protein